MAHPGCIDSGYREALEYVDDACGRVLRLAEGDRGSDRMAYQVVREMQAVVGRVLASTGEGV